MVRLLHDCIQVAVNSTFFVEENRRMIKAFVAVTRWLNLPGHDPDQEMMLLNCRLHEAAIDGTIQKSHDRVIFNIPSKDPVKERDVFLEALASFIKAYPKKELQTEADNDHLMVIAELMLSFTRLSRK